MLALQTPWMAKGALLTEWLERSGGIAHTSDARARGFTEHDVRSVLADGRVQRVRRSWLVARSAHPGAVAAVAAGGRLTCFSEAARLQLWTPDHLGLHVSVGAKSSAEVTEAVRFHRSPGPMPVADRAWCEPLVNVLHHVARCAPREEALAVWESAVRSGRIAADHLAAVKWSGPRARELAELTSLLSDSGLETIALDRLRSFGLPMRQQVRLEGHPVDLLIGERLVIQFDGFAFHSDAKARRRDLAHDARLTLLGYTVLRFDYMQVLFGWREVEASVLLAVAQGRHRAR